MPRHDKKTIPSKILDLLPIFLSSLPVARFSHVLLVPVP
jgi:hypothetical protein